MQTTAQFNIDSFKTSHKSDAYAQKIKAYLSFGETVGKQDFDDVIKMAQDGIVLANKNGDSLSVGILKRQIGESYYFKGNYNEAATYFFASIKIFEESNNKQNLANSYNAIAKLYRKTRDLSHSLQNYDRAMSIFKSLNDSAGVAMIYNESGVVFEYKEKYKEAESMQTELNNLKQQLDKLNLSSGNVNKDNIDVKSKNAALQYKLTQRGLELAANKRTIEQIRAELETITNKNNELIDERKKLNDDIKELNSKLTKCEADLLPVEKIYNSIQNRTTGNNDEKLASSTSSNRTIQSTQFTQPPLNPNNRPSYTYVSRSI